MKTSQKPTGSTPERTTTSKSIFGTIIKDPPTHLGGTLGEHWLRQIQLVGSASEHQSLCLGSPRGNPHWRIWDGQRNPRTPEDYEDEIGGLNSDIRTLEMELDGVL